MVIHTTKLKSTLLMGALICLCLAVNGQDVHLSQFYTSNTSLNPALTGHFDGDWRFQANYRSQWRQVTSPITTSMFSAEKKISRFRDEFGVGLILINDQAPAVQLNTNKILLSGSYQRYISKIHFRFGLQGGVVQRSISYGSQTYPTQWNYGSGNFDQSAPSGETDLKNNVSYPVVNSGLAATRLFGTAKITLGYAISYLNRPKDNFGLLNNRLGYKHTLHANAHLHLGPRLSILPNLLYLRANTATNLVANTLVEKRIGDKAAIFAGPGYRGSFGNSDAVILYTGIRINRFDIGLSFDYNISKLSKDASNKSSWELALSYTSPNAKVNKVTIPCDRY
ncbi:MAG: PorP/SprF family type IX secretion system membrane protein [Opitutaceae bacterium]|nr:PorP/SprF family type IX secretion system membrane protein [Cytophagales bacterium]